ncbi:MAG: Tim44 domain-containing protein [Burkholderiaceae bacterium]
MYLTHWTRYFMLAAAFVTTFVLLAPDAEARRMGGGRSIGKPAGSLFKRTPTKPPQQNAAAGSRNQAAAGGNRSGMMGMVGGLAAGLGLAWLASSLGFGEELANLMMILLLVAAGFIAFRFIASRMGGAGANAPNGLRPAGAGAGAGGNGMNRDGPGQSGNAAFSGVSPGQSSAQSAAGRDGPIPSGQFSPSGQTVGAVPSSMLQPGDLPADFDVEGFVHQAKVQFVRLQAVYDAGNLSDLASFTTPEMFAELKLEINQRNGADNQTDVVTLEAEMIGVDQEGSDYYASVHFSGMIREDPNASAQPFSELWTLTKPRSGESGWVLAGIQQMDSSA